MSSEPLLLACRRLVRRRPATRSEALAVLDDGRRLLAGLQAEVQVMLDLVQANRAVTLLAEVLVTAQLKAGQLVAVAVDCPEMTSTELQIVRRRGRKLSSIDFELMRHLSHALNQLLRAQ